MNILPNVQERLSRKQIVFVMIIGCFLQTAASWIGLGKWLIPIGLVFIGVGELYNGSINKENVTDQLPGLKMSGKQVIVTLIIGAGLQVVLLWIGIGWLPLVILGLFGIGEIYNLSLNREKPNNNKNNKKYRATREQEISRIV